ncbi:hypothetical protein, partial [Massilia cellulosiltytica]|uniref:hypothetical protein n=1 Tax=Massilia cellulosiltytica TaxID=2683234 RepID=UPI001E4E913F
RQRLVSALLVQVLLNYRELEPLIVLRHEKTPKVGVQLLGFSSQAALFLLGATLAHPSRQRRCAVQHALCRIIWYFA